MKRVAALYLPDWAVERVKRRSAPRDAGVSARSATAPVRGEAATAPRPAGAHSASDDTGFARGRPDVLQPVSENAHRAPAQAGAQSHERSACNTKLPPPPEHDRASRHLGDHLTALAPHVAAERANACSVPRGGGWRPGARWAKAEVQATIDAMPAHQRPPVRELGRRSEAAPHPFRAMRPDEGGHGGSSRDAFVTERSAWSRAGGNPGPHGSALGHPGLPPAREHGQWDGAPAAPLVLTHKIGPRVDVFAACPDARALGIHPGMALTQARAQTPGLIARDADPADDAADLAALAILLARRVSPIVAIDGAQGLLIDLTGVAHLHGGEAACVRRIVRQLGIRGFTARIAVASTPGAAHAIARGHGGAILRSHDDAAALRDLPVAALRLQPTQVELLRRLGIDTIGGLEAVARGPLARRFGAGIVARLDQAYGRVPEPLDPVVPREPIAIAQRFAEPIATAEAIGHWLGVLVPRLTAVLAAAGQGARRIEVIADRVDAVPQRIRIGLARPSRDAAHILRLLTARIGDVEPGYGIDAITLHLRAADPLGPEALGAELAGEAVPDLAPLVDTLTTRGSRLWRIAPLESDVPERSAAPAPPLDTPARAAPPLRRDDVRRLDTRVALHPWHPRWPRPVRLLPRPEPIDNVMALMPDGAPRRFTWRGSSYAVTHADGPERIAGEWWRRSGERAAIRDYFCVEDAAGTRFWLYRRGDGERAATGDLRWFLHGWFA